MTVQLRPGTAMARGARGSSAEADRTAPLELGLRMRRNRRTDWSRRLVRENRLSVDELLREVDEATKLGIPAVALFPNIDASLRDEEGSESEKPDNLVCRAIAAIKERFPQIGVMADV